MDEQLLFYVCIAGAVSAVGFFAAKLFVGNKDSRLRQRLEAAETSTQSEIEKPRATRAETVKHTLESIGSAAAQPFMPSTREKQSTLRKQLGFAGVYSPGAI